MDPRHVLRVREEIGFHAQLHQGIRNAALHHALRPHGIDEGTIGTAPRAVRRRSRGDRPTKPRRADRTPLRDDSRARIDQLANPLQHLLAHRVRIRQHQQLVFHAARHHDLAVLHLQQLDRPCRAEVVLDAVRPRQVDPRLRTVGRLLAAPAQDVRDETPFLEHPLAAALVAEPVGRQGPPRLRTLKVDSPASHRHGRKALVARPRLAGVAVIDDAVHAGGEHAVALRLDGERRREPASAVLRSRSERLRPGVTPTPHVREARRDRVARAADVVVAVLHAAPELRHRRVDGLSVLEVVRIAVAVGLKRAPQTVFVAQLREASGVVLGEEVGE